MQTALIFNIQKFSIHDGPGIRTTVFFKGCPLACQWCHNPESQGYGKEMLFHAERCTDCRRCEMSCPKQLIEMEKGQVVGRHSCSSCEGCVDTCYQNAREVIGKHYTVQQLMGEIEKDRPFYEQSGGGVTLSGGEVMTQIDFVEELVKTCKNQGISVAIDTCGYAPWENFLRIIEYVDVFLYDIKLIDPELHQRYTGQKNDLILENVTMLSKSGGTINIRLPLIAELNADDRSIEQVMEFISPLKISSINLLPYHNLAAGKYKKINARYEGKIFSKPSDERLAEIQDKLTQANYKVKIGG